MVTEHELVVLTHDVEEHGLRLGDIGVVVHCYADGQAFEVEFARARGGTVAVLTLASAAVRPLRSREILHVRDLVTAAG